MYKRYIIILNNLNEYHVYDRKINKTLVVTTTAKTAQKIIKNLKSGGAFMHEMPGFFVNEREQLSNKQ